MSRPTARDLRDLLDGELGRQIRGILRSSGQVREQAGAINTLPPESQPTKQGEQGIIGGLKFRYGSTDRWVWSP